MGDLSRLTMPGGLLADRVLSYPGALSEGHISSNFVLGGLHCLSDGVLRDSECVCIYFGRLVLPCGRAPLARVVGIHFLALSKPGQAHHLHSDSRATTVDRLRASRPTSERRWWTWRELNPRPARTYFNFSAAFRLPYDHIHCRPTKARRVLWSCYPESNRGSLVESQMS